MNKVILMGRLARDPELQTTPQGTPVCRFTVAVDRRFSGKDGQRQADFISCTAWRQTAEFVAKWFSKGRMIAVVGSLQTRTWDDKDGKKQYATDVIVDEAYFTGSKSDSNGGAPAANTSYSQPQAQHDSNANNSSAPFDDFDSMGFAAIGGSEDDLPF